MAIRRLGQILVELKYLEPAQLESLLKEQKQRPGELIGKIAIEKDFITEEQLAKGLARQLNLKYVPLGELTVPQTTLNLITEPMAQMYRIIPLELKDNRLTIAMCDPQKLSVLDELRSFLGFEIRPLVATERDVVKALDRYYSGGGESVESVIAELEHDTELAAAAKAIEGHNVTDLSSVEAMAESAPVRKLLNMILLTAIKDHASDIHFEPFEDTFRVRIRADGVLFEMVPPPRHLALALITRIKVLANLDIAERRLPQDGRIRLTVGGHPIDLRVSILPTMFGESAVLRVLDRSVVMLDLGQVGMDDYILQQVRETIRKPNGIMLVTGPTGSGKTTTLYGALNELNRMEDKLITTEDPVEYEIDGIVQIPIDAGIGNTFAQCLRSILRQDPDIILVGEIRDLETAEIAIQASLTGHMVFSTLHTNDAPSSITRLRDMGIPPFLITATLEGILAQRLVRRICADCREETIPSTDILSQLGLSQEQASGKKFYRGRGCATCNHSGYKGRTGLFELMICNDRLRNMINDGASTERLRDCAIQSGMRPLRAAGLEKIFKGLTTVDEVIRETVHD